MLYFIYIFLKKMNKKEDLILFKESALIACDGVLSLLERKIYNVLLYNARKTYFYKDDNYWEQNGYDGADPGWNFRNYLNRKENKFGIDVKNLKELANAREINDSDLDRIIDNLMQARVRTNILKKDKNETWEEEELFVLLPAIKKIKPEKTKTIQKLIYKIPDRIYDVIRQDENILPFCKIDLKIQKILKSKYSLTLYEIISDYNNSYKIPRIPINTFKKLMGISGNYRFSNITAKCIKPAILELQKIGIEINYEIIRDRKTPIAIQFHLQQKLNFTNQNKHNQEINIFDAFFINDNKIIAKNKLLEKR